MFGSFLVRETLAEPGGRVEVQAAPFLCLTWHHPTGVANTGRRPGHGAAGQDLRLLTELAPASLTGPVPLSSLPESVATGM